MHFLFKPESNPLACNSAYCCKVCIQTGLILKVDWQFKFKHAFSDNILKSYMDDWWDCDEFIL